jgi:hypothetical protein
MVLATMIGATVDYHSKMALPSGQLGALCGPRGNSMTARAIFT